MRHNSLSAKHCAIKPESEQSFIGGRISKAIKTPNIRPKQISNRLT